MLLNLTKELVLFNVKCKTMFVEFSLPGRRRHILRVLQESMIGEAESLEDRRRKAVGMKEKLQDATKLTQKLRFLVEEVRNPTKDRFGNASVC